MPAWTAGNRTGDLILTSEPGWAFSEPGPLDNPLIGNHGAPQTADERRRRRDRDAAPRPQGSGGQHRASPHRCVAARRFAHPLTGVASVSMTGVLLGHAGHYALYVLYAVPVVVVLGSIVLTAVRERR